MTSVFSPFEKSYLSVSDSGTFPWSPPIYHNTPHAMDWNVPPRILHSPVPLYRTYARASDKHPSCCLLLESEDCGNTCTQLWSTLLYSKVELVSWVEVVLGTPKKNIYRRGTLGQKFIVVRESEIVYPSLNIYPALLCK